VSGSDQNGLPCLNRSYPPLPALPDAAQRKLSARARGCSAATRINGDALNTHVLNRSRRRGAGNRTRIPHGAKTREQALDDIGHLAAFLASDAARNITGQWISVDGGITLRQAQ